MIEEFLRKVAAGRWKKLRRFQQEELQAQGLVYLDEDDTPHFTAEGRARLSDRTPHSGIVRGSGQG